MTRSSSYVICWVENFILIWNTQEILKSIGRVLSVSLYDRYSKDNYLQIVFIMLSCKFLSRTQIFEINLDGLLDKLYFDFLWGNIYGYYLLRCSFNTRLFSCLKVFQQNAFLFFWIMKLFPFGDCPTLFSTASKLV